ncbi:cell envelope-related transcriptional attenuator [Mycolicibacterium mageritense DSM 44476 = CIP 104973]|nr:cell envelope-related transcriptional attenuator [Mycolicibacterium mageritense DSM 44476 = CIP 104973]
MRLSRTISAGCSRPAASTRTFQLWTTTGTSPTRGCGVRPRAGRPLNRRRSSGAIRTTGRRGPRIRLRHPGTGRGTTWLLVGSDSRQGLSPEQQAELATGGDIGNGRTDTILIVHVPGLGSSTPATMVSIPRDSYVPIPGYGEDKINAAFSLGGAPLLAQTVEQATGLRLDHYAEIGFDGFAALVDAVGGVTMCPPEPITDPLAGIDLPAGCQRLDGRNALGYVRTRATPRADLDRMVNQRLFMSALLHRATSPSVLLNPLRWYPMAHAAGATVTVDQDAHIWDLAWLAWALHGDPVTTTVPIGEFTGSDSGSVVVWDSDAAGRLFAALAADDPAPPDTLNTQ